MMKKLSTETPALDSMEDAAACDTFETSIVASETVPVTSSTDGSDDDAATSRGAESVHSAWEFS